MSATPTNRIREAGYNIAVSPKNSSPSSKNSSPSNSYGSMWSPSSTNTSTPVSMVSPGSDSLDAHMANKVTGWAGSPVAAKVQDSPKMDPRSPKMGVRERADAFIQNMGDRACASPVGRVV